MEYAILHALELRKFDVQGAVKRLGGDEQLYLTCLKRFVDDTTMAQLNKALAQREWDDAFTAAHALKGVAGNLGLIPFMHAIGQLVIIIRGGRTDDIEECMSQVRSCYRDIIDVIREKILS